MDDKKTTILTIAGVLLLVIMVTGISAALFIYTGTGSKENVITTGQISISYAESSKIELTNQYPMSDELGIANTESVMNFTVSGKIGGSISLNYVIGLDSIVEGTTLTQEYIKVYLLKGDTVVSTFEEGTGKTISSLEQYFIQNHMNSYAMYTDTFTTSGSQEYTIKAWIDESYNLAQTDISSGTAHGVETTSETFKFKVKVVGTDGPLVITNDNTAPVIEDIEISKIEETAINKVKNNIERIANTEELILNTNDQIKVEVIYNEKIQGTAPTLNLTFGETTASGTPSAGTITNNKIEYTYTVQESDGGSIGVALTGGNITDRKNQVSNNTISPTILTTLENVSKPLPPNLDTSGANAPDLVTGMVPVRYDGTNWVIADKYNSDVNNQWYSYATSGTTKGMWANAVLVKETGTVHNRDYYTNQANVGQTVSMDDILQMYVWIPRFVVNTGGLSTQAYFESIRGTATNNKYLTPGAINISFVDKNTAAHDAFTFDGNKSGIWVGKFQTTGTIQGVGENANTTQACTNETCDISQVTIKPNLTRLTNQTISSSFYVSRSIEQPNNLFGLISNEVDTHMLKNNEWGAVIYLSQSIYGRCTNSTTCSEIGKFNSSTTYETALGQNTSTTGTIYGIYDMNGIFESVMGVYWDGDQYWSGYNSTHNSGFKGCLGEGCSSVYDGIEFFSLTNNAKYYNSYTTESDYTTANLQHAMIEISGWYGNYIYLRLIRGSSWIIRDNNYTATYSPGNGGAYGDSYMGNFRGYSSFHISLVK